jgi:hypothetical protein
MIITTEYVDIEVDGSPMRMCVAAPKPEGVYPGVVFYSDIFQLTGVMLRATARLAGYGFVVAAPEIYHRLEPPDERADTKARRKQASRSSMPIVVPRSTIWPRIRVWRAANSGPPDSASADTSPFAPPSNPTCAPPPASTGRGFITASWGATPMPDRSHAHVRFAASC